MSEAAPRPAETQQPRWRPLTAIDRRVAGVLVEKAKTTPDAYPMTLNALTTACNQSTNRDPVVQYDATQVETTLLALKGKGLIRVVHPGSGERATKYRHVLDEVVHRLLDRLAALATDRPLRSHGLWPRPDRRAAPFACFALCAADRRCARRRHPL